MDTAPVPESDKAQRGEQAKTSIRALEGPRAIVADRYGVGPFVPHDSARETLIQIESRVRGSEWIIVSSESAQPGHSVHRQRQPPGSRTWASEPPSRSGQEGGASITPHARTWYGNGFRRQGYMLYFVDVRPAKAW